MNALSRLGQGLRLTLVLWLLTVVVITVPMLGLARIAAPRQAEGSLVRVDGRVVGSALIGQAFAGDRYLRGRPSAVAYGSGDPPSSGPSNLAPGNPALAQRVAAEVVVWSERGVGSVAADLLTSSGSGLDPDISLAAARQQLPRIAAARQLPPDRLEALLERHSHRPLLGLARPPLVNVLAFNVALDELVP
ncbi:K(+)-transporting ATPase subunit C [Synechococcus sp. CCAP 1479/9]|uniref:K(+)-transporting ATPase subunit C n=1 Tax=Synechococcus sp. CCAP 1479/9 TaxID=1221593 RepID=UPI001C233E36|nr:K(+)-transporting ATPase subunit C [Synechococcus sp. CCAP 1479/9]